jgi:hypothetical protein
VVVHRRLGHCCLLLAGIILFVNGDEQDIPRQLHDRAECLVTD